MAKKKQKAKVKAVKSKASKVSSVKSVSLPVMPKLPTLPKIDRKKVLIGLVVVAVLALLYFFKGLFVAAIVNGQPITRIALVRELEKQEGSQVLSALVTKAVIAQEAKKNNVTVTQDEVNAEISKIDETIKSQGQTLDDALASQGWTRTDLEDQVKTQLIVERLLSDKVKVTEEEIDEYIKANNSTDPRQTISELLKQQKLMTEYQSWVAGLMANAKINYWVNF